MIGTGIRLWDDRPSLGWWKPGASLDLDFVNNRGYRSPAQGTAASLLTTTRASTAYADDTAGAWTAFASNIPRITDKGLLVEEARTNSIRNNSMQGAVAGTPGTLPTNWSTSAAGTTVSVVGSGTQNGIDYIDIRYAGTTSAVFLNLLLEASSSIAALNGQAWAGSVFLAVAGGSFTNITGVALRSAMMSVAPAYLGEGWTPTVYNTRPPVLSGAARISETGTLANASTAWIYPYLQMTFASGVAIDITLRIGWPQLELGAFATSPIRTTSAAATRAADAITVNDFSSWFNAGPSTLYADAMIPADPGASFYLAAITDSSVNSNSTELLVNASDAAALVGYAATVAAGSAAAGVVPYGTPFKAAATIALNDFQPVLEGALGTPDTSGALPGSLDRARLGARVNSAFPMNGYLRRVSYFPARLTNAQLQALTAP